MNRKASFYIERSVAIIAAILLLQSMFFMLTEHPDSILVFKKIGGEPYVRILSGLVELIVSFLLLFSRTSLTGAILGIFISLCSLYVYFFKLRGVFQNSGSENLLVLILVTLVCYCIIVYIKRKQVLSAFEKFLKSKLWE